MGVLKDHIEPDLMDNVSVVAGLGVILGWLPTVLSIVTIVWFSLRIWESDTVRGLTKRTKEQKNEEQS
jgi:hypothetical protein